MNRMYVPIVVIQIQLGIKDKTVLIVVRQKNKSHSYNFIFAFRCLSRLRCFSGISFDTMPLHGIPGSVVSFYLYHIFHIQFS